jgi:hypothetical protein
MRMITAGLVLAAVLSGCPVVSGADGGALGSDGGASGGSGGTGGAAGGGTGVVTTDGGVAFAPELLTVEARVAGRTGKDLLLTVKGKDRNLDATQVWLRLMDSLGNLVAAIDTDRDGQADSAETSLPLEGKHWASETVTGTATLRGLFAHPANVLQVGVTLVDAAGLRSDESVVLVLAQAVRAMGEPCDPLFVADRCSAGLGCRGTPTVCSEGLAPQIGRLAFFHNATGGPTIIMEGTEPEDDLATIRFQFQNAQGAAISIDSDGDGVPDLASFDQDALELAVDGAFFLRMQSGDGLDQQVPKLVAIPTDSAGHTGLAKIVAPTAIPVRTSGQTCDVRGFDTCGPNLSCTPGIIGATNKCASATPLRTAQCSAATVLTPTVSGATATGVAEGGSLWDAPAGCSTNNPTGRPEGVVKLHVVERAARLTLSTVGPGTTFDTTMYVLPGCPNDTQDVLACSDDFPGAGGASQLELFDVAPGDYLVVVDSFAPIGGAFELTATVQ